MSSAKFWLEIVPIMGIGIISGVYIFNDPLKKFVMANPTGEVFPAKESELTREQLKSSSSGSSSSSPPAAEPVPTIPSIITPSIAAVPVPEPAPSAPVVEATPPKKKGWFK